MVKSIINTIHIKASKDNSAFIVCHAMKKHQNSNQQYTYKRKGR